MHHKNDYTLSKRLLLLFLIGLAASGFVKMSYSDYVNPMLGTAEHGHTFPGAALPGGMVQLGPDTDIKGWDWCSGYHYSDSSIMGFSHLHRSGMGAGDWGDILLMPTTGKLKTEPGRKEVPGEGYRSAFSHQEELASPGYYGVTLKDYDIKAQLTVTTRAGFHAYQFPKSEAAHILIDLSHGIGDKCTDAGIRILSDTEMEGFRASKGFVKDQKVYFHARFSKPFHASGTWNQSAVHAGSKEENGTQVGAFADYLTADHETIYVKVGISYTSTQEARLNLEKEIPDWNFDRVSAAAKKQWDNALGKIAVSFDKQTDASYSKQKLTTFYTALYHSLLFPATFSDADGHYTGLDYKEHVAAGFRYRSDFSLWDTFRAEMPLLTLIEPERSNDAVNTMVAQYEQGGWMPTPQQFGNSYTNDMIGDHPVDAILDAYQKGIRNYDIEKAYEGIRKNAMEVPPSDHRSRGRTGLDPYKKYGYVPYDLFRESVSRTLEYAYNDWCVAQLAKALGKTEDYNLFITRAENYKHVIDTQTGFARPKNSDGKWLSPFDPTFVGSGKERHYTEANAWQYTWFVPHDVQGLIQLEGGRQRFVERLDSLFSVSSEIHNGVSDITGLIGQYAHGNEPGHHTVYLFNYAGAPWKTQAMVRRVMDELYSDGVAGLCGNEDMGQMSAWYVLSSMGFYPVAPGQNVYVIGSPEFSKITLHLDKAYYPGVDFVIEARNNSHENKYIQSATLNGQPLHKPWFDHEAIRRGGKLVLQMGPEPNKSWGQEPSDAPPSLSSH
ncbi:MAG: GH92 family glycosyl hydrolase [Marinilabiliales bacterium]|nr:GH92 family glycosyl hydrolase [Marinilabiliales bacterium]